MPTSATILVSSHFCSRWFPSPPIIVFARNCFAVPGHARHSVVVVSAVFSRLVAVTPIREGLGATGGGVVVGGGGGVVVVTGGGGGAVTVVVVVGGTVVVVVVLVVVVGATAVPLPGVTAFTLSPRA
jgi:hypothetical protein